ncbi:hypothetical protein [Mycobacteroides abscessus]|nr:hypothetical protein [Mycobacteroides abscessus]
MDQTTPAEPAAAEDESTDDDYLEPGDSSCRFAYLPSADGDAA